MKNSFYAAVMTGLLILTGCSETAAVNITETDSSAATAASSEPTQTTVQSVKLTDSQKANLTEFFNSIDIIDEDILKGSFDGLIDIAMLEPDKAISYSESLTKTLIDRVRQSDSYHILYADDNVKMETAVKGNRMKLAVCIDTTASSMFFEDSTVYSYYPIEKSGYKVTLSDEDMQSYTPENLLNSMLYYPENDEETVTVSLIEVGNETYTCELFEGFAYIFRKDGTIAMFCDKSNCFTVKVETENVADELFSIPFDYATVDYNQLMESLQTTAENNE